MREYKIKRGHNPDVEALVSEYFNAEGNLDEGINFSHEGIGTVFMKQDGKSLMVDIEPPKKPCSDYSIIKKWNKFLFEATGRNAKERKKRMTKKAKKK